MNWTRASATRSKSTWRAVAEAQLSTVPISAHLGWRVVYSSLRAILDWEESIPQLDAVVQSVKKGETVDRVILC